MWRGTEVAVLLIGRDAEKGNLLGEGHRFAWQVRGRYEEGQNRGTEQREWNDLGIKQRHR